MTGNGNIPPNRKWWWLGHFLGWFIILHPTLPSDSQLAIENGPVELVDFRSYKMVFQVLCKHLPDCKSHPIKAPCSYRFPMVFLWFSWISPERKLPWPPGVINRPLEEQAVAVIHLERWLMDWFGDSTLHTMWCPIYIYIDTQCGAPVRNR